MAAPPSRRMRSRRAARPGLSKGSCLDKGDEGGVGSDGSAEAEQGIQHPTGGGKPGEGRQQLEHHEAAADGQVEGWVHPHQGGGGGKTGRRRAGPKTAPSRFSRGGRGSCRPLKRRRWPGRPPWRGRRPCPGPGLAASKRIPVCRPVLPPPAGGRTASSGGQPSFRNEARQSRP